MTEPRCCFFWGCPEGSNVAVDSGKFAIALRRSRLGPLNCTFLYIASSAILPGKHSEQVWFHMAPPTVLQDRALHVHVNIPDVVCWTNLALEMGCGIIARRQDFPGRNGEACTILERVGCYAIRFTLVCAVRNISFCVTSRVVMTAKQEYTTSKFGTVLENVSHFV